jgi:hypothetical protein
MASLTTGILDLNSLIVGVIENSAIGPDSERQTVRTIFHGYLGGMPSTDTHFIYACGLVDCLQSFDTRKRIEYTWKQIRSSVPFVSGQTEGTFGVLEDSVAEPNRYAERLLKFINNIFD